MWVVVIIKYNLFAINIKSLLTLKIIAQTDLIEESPTKNYFIPLLENVEIFP